ncbi:unnamed protein product [Vitrella brassicaformis CCMP3155]|uniref:Thioesterase domain-containing protein n=1 Tax=Vitrella brassicaformis (strain CCMP3155) TaxID=1169540 RepID=A0A0G4EKJ8_VITBC|nr:unnamed protein product [Vitrella brassicaformis CCMP3155]|mmetsp:Transcript_28038/g.70023  ORF Transcript_28038/g.70023 Transcript_28038/m.70023 type:complete len:299 (-) Transcript_28038:696-1592(-)|eukprot:CEL97646.1 unnamed protein product [Vitrella brassicaformis CCMP3155]
MWRHTWQRLSCVSIVGSAAASLILFYPSPRKPHLCHESPTSVGFAEAIGVDRGEGGGSPAPIYRSVPSSEVRSTTATPSPSPHPHPIHRPPSTSGDEAHTVDEAVRHAFPHVTVRHEAPEGLPNWTLRHLPNGTLMEHHFPPREDGYQLIHDTLVAVEGIRLLRYFLDPSKERLTVVCQTGTNVCGHRGVVHGGFTSALLDNAFGMLAFANTPSAATAQLTVNYKKPILAGEVIVVVVKLVKQEGRKIFMEAEIIGDADGPQTKNVLATADCLMINIAQSSTWQQRVQKKEANESKTD